LIAAAALELVSPSAPSVEATAKGPVALRLGIWQLWGEPKRQVNLKVDGQTRLCELQALGPGSAHPAWCVRCPSLTGFPDEGIRLRRLGESRLEVNGIDLFCECCLLGDELFIQLGPEGAVFGVNGTGEQLRAGPAADAVLSPMPGRIVAIQCATGDRIRAGQPLIIMEAMKMELALCCERDGVVESIPVRVDEQISQGREVLRLERVSE
ncbi:MAG: biotin/lipoyl-binding protein, partial [Granulosicoccus sp.]|nr:biotin/lipoyl-binding protein [Granulosicoccus sp.]